MTRILFGNKGWKVVLNRFLKDLLIIVVVFGLMFLIDLIPTIDLPLFELGLGQLLLAIADTLVKALKQYHPELIGNFEWFFEGLIKFLMALLKSKKA